MHWTVIFSLTCFRNSISTIMNERLYCPIVDLPAEAKLLQVTAAQRLRPAAVPNFRPTIYGGKETILDKIALQSQLLK